MPNRQVRIKVSRIYQYPFCVLNKTEPFLDALGKAKENLIIDIGYIVKNKFEDGSQLFTAEVTEEPLAPLVKRGDAEDYKSEITVYYDNLLTKLVNDYISVKYGGDISFETHPELYHPVKKGKSSVYDEVRPRLKEEISNELEVLKMKYRDIIDSCEMRTDMEF